MVRKLKPPELKGAAVERLIKYRHGDLWFGLWGHRGLARWDCRAKKFQHFDLSKSVKVGIIKAIVEDPLEDWLWLATDYGLLRFDKTNVFGGEWYGERNCCFAQNTTETMKTSQTMYFKVWFVAVFLLQTIALSAQNKGWHFSHLNATHGLFSQLNMSLVEDEAALVRRREIATCLHLISDNFVLFLSIFKGNHEQAHLHFPDNF